jgi:Na+-translocating ferredoxin:NAD+ oxidoreductase RnfG subunit
MLHKKTPVLAIEYPFEQIAFKIAIVVFIAIAATYIYCVFASVLNVIARKEALTRTAQIATVIGDKEQRYFTLSQNVTPEEGARLGLVPLSQPSYVNRPGNVGQAESAQGTI